jgi:hypothetical protein
VFLPALPISGVFLVPEFKSAFGSNILDKPGAVPTETA